MKRTGDAGEPRTIRHETDFLIVVMKSDGETSIAGRNNTGDQFEEFDSIGSLTVFIDELTEARDAAVKLFGDDWDAYGSRHVSRRKGEP